MEVGCVEHVVAEVPHKESLRKIAVEGFSLKFVGSYFIH